MPAIWDFDWTGVSLVIMDKRVKIEEQPTEVFDERMGLQLVLTHAHNIETGEHLFSKIRYELDPDPLGFENPEKVKEIAKKKKHFLHEVSIAKLVSFLLVQKARNET